MNNNKWLQPGFLTAAAILGFAAIGLNAAVSKMHLYWEKERVPLTRELDTMPARLGDWVQVSKDEPLDKEVQDALATKQFIFRDYVDSRLVSPDDLAKFDGKTSQERKALVGRLQVIKPEAVVNLAVTYYTGLVDTVAHIPDRCMIADGFEPSEYETPDWDMGPNRLGKGPKDDPKIGVRFINFSDQTAAGRVQRRVAYFFFTDGQYVSNPIEVRKILGTLRFKHGFYSKVELMSILPDHDQAVKVMTGFLQVAMPEIEKCLPDWNQVEYQSVKS
jgi:Protein of unknown function (DUF3485)